MFNITVTSASQIKIHAEPHPASPFGAINGVQVQCLNGPQACKCVLQVAPVTAEIASPSGGTPIGGGVLRHLQVHRELTGNVETIVGQAFRRDAMAAMAPGATAGTIEVELWVGEGDLANVSPAFANNYLGTRTNVIQRKRVNLPDWTQRPATSPAPFDFVLKYDSPYRYSGRGDFVWELIVHSSSSQGGHPVDAVLPATSRLGSSSPLGVGCAASGQTIPLQATAFVTTFNATKPKLTYQTAINNGTPGAACAVLLGFANPALPLPLCRPDLRLYTDGRITIPGQIGSNGSFQAPGLQTKWASVLAGTPLFTQAATVDPTGLTVSNGVVSPIPALPQPGPYAWVRATGNAQATTGTVLNGAAMVTQVLR